MHKVDGTEYAVLKMHNCHESDVVLHDTVCSHMFFYNSTHSLSTVAGTGGAGGGQKIVACLVSILYTLHWLSSHAHALERAYRRACGTKCSLIYISCTNI